MIDETEADRVGTGSLRGGLPQHLWEEDLTGRGRSGLRRVDLSSTRRVANVSSLRRAAGDRASSSSLSLLFERGPSLERAAASSTSDRSSPPPPPPPRSTPRSPPGASAAPAQPDGRRPRSADCKTSAASLVFRAVRVQANEGRVSQSRRATPSGPSPRPEADSLRPPHFPDAFPVLRAADDRLQPLRRAFVPFPCRQKVRASTLRVAPKKACTAVAAARRAPPSRRRSTRAPRCAACTAVAAACRAPSRRRSAPRAAPPAPSSPPRAARPAAAAPRARAAPPAPPSPPPRRASRRRSRAPRAAPPAPPSPPRAAPSRRRSARRAAPPAPPPRAAPQPPPLRAPALRRLHRRRRRVPRAQPPPLRAPRCAACTAVAAACRAPSRRRSARPRCARRRHGARRSISTVPEPKSIASSELGAVLAEAVLEYLTFAAVCPSAASGARAERNPPRHVPAPRAPRPRRGGSELRRRVAAGRQQSGIHADAGGVGAPKSGRADGGVSPIGGGGAMCGVLALSGVVPSGAASASPGSARAGGVRALLLVGRGVHARGRAPGAPAAFGTRAFSSKKYSLLKRRTTVPAVATRTSPICGASCEGARASGTSTVAAPPSSLPSPRK